MNELLASVGLTPGRLLRAILSGCAVFVTGIAVYQVPPDLVHLYQPAMQALLAMLTSLGLSGGAAKLSGPSADVVRNPSDKGL